MIYVEAYKLQIRYWKGKHWINIGTYYFDSSKTEEPIVGGTTVLVINGDSNPKTFVSLPEPPSCLPQPKGNHQVTFHIRIINALYAAGYKTYNNHGKLSEHPKYNLFMNNTYSHTVKVNKDYTNAVRTLHLMKEVFTYAYKDFATFPFNPSKSGSHLHQIVDGTTILLVGTAVSDAKAYLVYPGSSSSVAQKCIQSSKDNAGDLGSKI